MNPEGTCHVAIDLGAESGRVIVARLADQKLTLDEVHRFANGPVEVEGTLRWNIDHILTEIKSGLKKTAGLPIESMSVDSWGVDYVLIDEEGAVVTQPWHYRDSRTDASYEKSLAQAGKELIFAETGIQFMQINTLYQLIAENESNPQLLQSAKQFLTIADYINFRLCGVAAVDHSNASTTQIYNPKTRQWSKRLIEEFDLPADVFPSICEPGEMLGSLLPEIQAKTGLGDVPVVATCSHDTGAAVAAVPANDGEHWAYLSSGTWSLLGVELQQPLMSDAALAENFTNEAGFGSTTRFLRNIIGLWILQESRRTWREQGNDLEYSTISTLAAKADPFRSLINPNDARFLKPGNMPERIAEYCRETDQPVPETVGQFSRCILESLAFLYRRNLERLELLTQRRITTLHIVGGGSNSDLLNAFTANATGRTVLAGPTEATAIGNALIQAVSLGDIESIGELRQVVRNSFSIKNFQPENVEQWQSHWARFLNLEPIHATNQS